MLKLAPVTGGKLLGMAMQISRTKKGERSGSSKKEGSLPPKGVGCLVVLRAQRKKVGLLFYKRGCNTILLGQGGRKVTTGKGKLYYY